MLERILNSTPHNIAVLDGELNLVYANGNFLRLVKSAFGKELKIGQPLVDFLPPDKRLRLTLRMEEVLNGQSNRIEEALEIKGQTRYFDVTYQPLSEPDEGGTSQKVVIILEEITARKRREARLMDSNTELRELVSTRETLLSVISHDLRSPIFQLNGLLYLIRQATEKRDEARLKLHAEDLEDRILHLTHTIDNLLGWASMQRHSLEPRITRFNLGEVFQHAIGLCKPSAQTKGVEIILPEAIDIEVASDREMIAFIARNLINNAIKFSTEAGKVVIEVGEFSGMVKLSVTDHGVGFPAGEVDRIREGVRFAGAAGTWGERGTGIGLQLCYEFAERLGGTILIDSAKGKGTVVTVRLPQGGAEGTPSG